MNKPLTITEIKEKAPSIFADAPHSKMSDRYSMVKSIDMIYNFEKAGWYPSKVMQERSKVYDGTQKHMVRFRNDFSIDMKVKSRVPEILMINSHNGRSKCVFRLGIFELVCENGLVVETMSLAQINQMHIGINYSEFKKALDVYVKNADVIMKEIPKYEAKKLTKNQQIEFATQALKMKFYEKFGVITPEQVLKTRRVEDEEPTLWKTFNVVQENIVKGGIHYQLHSNSDNVRRSTSKQISNINMNTYVNTMLWGIMAAFYAKVK